MLKLLTGIAIALSLCAAPVAFADTGATEDTGAAFDTGSVEILDDTGVTDDTAVDSSGAGRSPTYGAADLAGESGGCATAAAAPAGWMLGCVFLVLVRRRFQ